MWVMMDNFMRFSSPRRNVSAEAVVLLLRSLRGIDEAIVLFVRCTVISLFWAAKDPCSVCRQTEEGIYSARTNLDTLKNHVLSRRAVPGSHITQFYSTI